MIKVIGLRLIPYGILFSTLNSSSLESFQDSSTPRQAMATGSAVSGRGRAVPQSCVSGRPSMGPP